MRFLRTSVGNCGGYMSDGEDPSSFSLDEP